MLGKDLARQTTAVLQSTAQKSAHVLKNSRMKARKSTGGLWPLLLQAIGTYQMASAFLGEPILRTTIAIANKKNGPEAGSQSIRRRPGTLSLRASILDRQRCHFMLSRRRVPS
jgi:hypothetical protein